MQYIHLSMILTSLPNQMMGMGNHEIKTIIKSKLITMMLYRNPLNFAISFSMNLYLHQ